MVWHPRRSCLVLPWPAALCPIPRMPNLREVIAAVLLIVLGCLCSMAAEATGKAGDDLFADGVVTQLRIEVAATELEVLRRYAFNREAPQEDRQSVRCTVREGALVWTNVAVHLKGSAGSFRPVDDKPSMTLNFARHESHQRFHGLAKISLNNSVQDPTRVSEKLNRELYTRGGIPVPRAGYATAELNGRRLGLYVMLEGWDRHFIQRHFSDARGPLYEGRFLSDIDQPPIVAYGNAARSQITIPQLLAAAREANAAKRRVDLEAVLDLDRFTRLLALDVLCWNGDGYAFHANNYRILCDRSQDRFVFLAHGLDQSFFLPDAPLLAGGDGMVAWAVLSLPEGRQRVLERIREFRASFYQPESVKRRALEIAAMVTRAEAMASGITNAGAVSPPGPAVVEWVQRILERFASIDQQLVGITNLLSLQVGQSVVLTNWTQRILAGAPTFQSTNGALTLLLATNTAAAWVSPQWLEQGHYRLQGRVRRSGPLTTGPATPPVAAGFRIRAPRKRSLGLDWGWDARRRVDDPERFTLASQLLPAAAGTNWVELNCDLDLRQPVADVELLAEASGRGEVQFEMGTLRLTRLTDPGR